MPEVTEKFEEWAILELMGHRRLAGKVSEQVIAGQGFIRIDIPNGEKMTTQFYGPGSVYALTPVAEDVARRLAASINAAPINPWEFPRKELPGGSEEDDDRPEGWNGDGM